MGIPSLGPWFRNLIAIPAALSMLCACAGSILFEDMRAEYQSTEIPAVFASGKRGWLFSGFITGNNQDPIHFQRKDSVWWETADSSRFYTNPGSSFDKRTPGVLQGEYRIDRSRILAGGALAYQRRHWFCGISLAQGSTFGLGQMGAFGGWSQPIGNWVPLIAGGGYANRVRTSGKVWSEFATFPLPVGENATPDGYFPDTVSGHRTHYSMPVRLGVLYRAGRHFAPYITLAGNSVSMWPGEDEDPGRYEVLNSDLALGARYSPNSDLTLGVELALTTAEGPNSYSADAAKVAITVERAWR